MSAAYERVVDALRANGSHVIERGTDTAQAQCPCPGHGAGRGDNNPSLSIYPRKDGKGISITCHAGCDYADALTSVGLAKRDLYDDAGMRGVYGERRDYTYPGGRVVHRKPGKDFPQSGNMQDRTLYGQDAITPDSVPLAVEGERDVEAAAAVGVVAVSAPMGARNVAKADWSAVYDHHVIAVVDADDEGKMWAHALNDVLSGSVRTLRFARAKAGKDLADHIAAGYGVDELVEIPLTALGRPGRTVAPQRQRAHEPPPDDYPQDDLYQHHNGATYDDVPLPNEPPDDGQQQQDTEPTTWEPIDLGPYLRGEILPVRPSVGTFRTDGQRLIYPGLEHSVIAHTGAGKTWFALLCAAAEILAGNTVAYLHFEESTPASTIERLLRIGLPADVIERLLLFVAPAKALRHGWLDTLLAAQPTLTVIDGVNEAMVLNGQKIDLEGWSYVRHNLVVPFKEVGSGVLECDHLPLAADPLRGDAYGTVHKGNVIDGARFALVRKELFGRGRRGVSFLFSTKDRPGYVNESGRVGGDGNVFVGTFVVDDSPTGNQDFATLYAPNDADDEPDDVNKDGALRDAVFDVIAKQPERTVPSMRQLYALLRAEEHKFNEHSARDAIDDLVVAARLIEVSGSRNACGYKATAVEEPPQ